MKTILLIILILTVASPVFSATYTVRENGSGDYTTIQACANAATAGDTCLVGEGTYSGASVNTSGTAGNRITFLADSSGSQPVISTLFDFNNESYITLDGFELVQGVTCVGCSFIEIKNNKVTNTDIGIGGGQNDLDGTDILIDGNSFGQRGDDIVKGNGDRWVIRNNIATNIDDTFDEHLDFYQNSCKNLPGDFVLVENNLYADVTGPNVHFFLINCSSGRRTNHIIRYNKVRDIGSSAVTFDDSAGGTGFDGATVYNNTWVRTSDGALYNTWRDYNSTLADVDTGRGGQNNIYYDAVDPIGAEGIYPATVNADGSLLYDPDYTINVDGAAENSEGVIVNQDPLFNDVDNNDFSLQPNSPAIDAGYHLTTVATSDTSTGTTLIVNNPWYFQPGWAGVEGDMIAVGSATNTAQITAINYSTGALTIAPAISRSDGDPVYLYADSDGTIVFKGAAPDIGAVESGPSAPTGFKLVTD